MLVYSCSEKPPMILCMLLLNYNFIHLDPLSFFLGWCSSGFVSCIDLFEEPTVSLFSILYIFPVLYICSLLFLPTGSFGFSLFFF